MQLPTPSMQATASPTRLKDVSGAIKTQRQNNGVPFSTDRSALQIEQFAPLWLQRQRLLLELMYHNPCINLYRPSISFASATGQTPLAGGMALKCSAHAMALTHIMHQVLTSTSILAGWLEAFQWQWNAAMTLVGIVLAFPHNDSTGAARSIIDLSVAVLENFGNSFAVATGAASILGELCAKVDVLIENGQRKKAVRLEKTQVVTNYQEVENMQVVTNYQEVGEQSLTDGDSAAVRLEKTQVVTNY